MSAQYVVDVIPDKLIAMLSLAVSAVEVQLVKLVDEFSTAFDNVGFVPAPMMLVTGNPVPSADLNISIVIEPLGLPIKSHPVNVPPYGILVYDFVPVLSADPEPSTTNVTACVCDCAVALSVPAAKLKPEPIVTIAGVETLPLTFW